MFVGIQIYMISSCPVIQRTERENKKKYEEDSYCSAAQKMK